MEHDWADLGLHGPAEWVDRAEEEARSGDSETAVLLLSDALAVGFDVFDRVGPEDAILECLVRAVNQVGGARDKEALTDFIIEHLAHGARDEPVRATVLSWLRTEGLGTFRGVRALGSALATFPDRESKDEAYRLLVDALTNGDSSAGPIAVQLVESDEGDVKDRLGELARLGCAEASRALAWVMLDRGRPSRRDETLMWLYRAQRQGSSDARPDLALLLMAEAPPNLPEARYWLSQSAALGEAAEGTTLQAACDGDPAAGLRTAWLLSERGLIDSRSVNVGDPAISHWIIQALEASEPNLLLQVAELALWNLEPGVAWRAAERARERARARRRAGVTDADDEVVLSALALALIQAFTGQTDAARRTLVAIAGQYESVMPDNWPELDALRDSLAADPGLRRSAREMLGSADGGTDAPAYIALSHDMEGDHQSALSYWELVAQGDDPISATMAESLSRYSLHPMHRLSSR